MEVSNVLTESLQDSEDISDLIYQLIRVDSILYPPEGRNDSNEKIN